MVSSKQVMYDDGRLVIKALNYNASTDTPESVITNSNNWNQYFTMYRFQYYDGYVIDVGYSHREFNKEEGTNFYVCITQPDRYGTSYYIYPNGDINTSCVEREGRTGWYKTIYEVRSALFKYIERTNGLIPRYNAKEKLEEYLSICKEPVSNA
jgi:hypothetical protein